MRIGVISDNRWKDEAEFMERLATHFDGKEDSVTFVVGGAPGPDSWVKKFAKNNGCDYVMFLPYHKLDKSAPFTPKYFFVRNRQIISNSDVVMVFTTDLDYGADITHAIDYTFKKNKELITEVI